MRLNLLYVMLAGLLLVLVNVGGAAAQEPADEVEIEIQAGVNSRISYQGVLKENGQAVTGSRNFVFRIYSNSGCTTQVGSDINKNSVSVTDGLFAVELDVPVDTFDGSGRWMRVRVGGTTVVSCQEVLPVPYALNLRPGATVTGSDPATGFDLPWYLLGSSTTDGSMLAYLSYSNDTTAGLQFNAGVYGESTASKGVGVRGKGGTYGLYGEGGTYGTYSEGDTYGVYGETASVTGMGVYGKAPQSTMGTGVYGSGAYGVWGYGTSYGVYASTPSGSQYSQAIRGISYSSATDSAGVYGEAGSSSGNVHGVYGVSRSTNGGIAVAGINYGDRHAGYFQTDDYVSLTIVNDSNSYYALEINNKNSQGDLIKALNSNSISSDIEFRVEGDGTIFADGSYNCGYTYSSCFNTGSGADLAERIDSREPLLPGEVVEIDPDNPQQFRRAETPYSALVAGVISTQPGMTLGNDFHVNGPDEDWEDDRPLLALVGTAPVKVSAENGSIEIGDLLVASATPGHAMKAGSNPPLGTIIGKALEPLESGTGVIKMLVMLQ